ncbi:NFACT family protein, partial [Staphylococcus warneri]|uniref:NFACT family protein n=1 Tax=Staphylococcus warneri TaxID=1292 RepID=UPI0016423FD3
GMFGGVFGKDLEGGIIKSIGEIGNERRVEMDVESKDEMGDRIHGTIILEIMGKDSKLIIEDDDRKIHEGLK